MSLPVKVKHCIIINLDRRQDLWDSLSLMREEMADAGIEVHRLVGRDANDEPELIANLYRENILDLNSCGWRKNVKQLRGELGCFSSHYLALRKVVEDKLEPCLITEDGIECLRTDFNNLTIPKGLDIGICHPHLSQRVKLDGWGLQGYIVTVAAAQKVLNKAFPLTCPFDIALRELMRKYELAYFEQEKHFFKRKNDRKSSVGLPEGHTDDKVVEKQDFTPIWQRIVEGCLNQKLNLEDLMQQS